MNIPSPSIRSIGTENESSLHSSIKNWYYKPGDMLEVKVEGYVVDIVRDDLLIEIQTKNFGAIRDKLSTLAKSYRVKLVYPIAEEKYIVKIEPSTGEIVSRRKSPKQGKIIDIFDELVSAPCIINEPNITIEVLFIKQEDIYLMDGKGSWRRKGLSIADRKLVDILKAREFETSMDFLDFIPPSITMPFTNRTLSDKSGYPRSKCQKVTYCLKKMGVIEEAGKKGRELLFNISQIVDIVK